jgi:hypothetical protein
LEVQAFCHQLRDKDNEIKLITLKQKEISKFILEYSKMVKAKKRES